MPEDILEPAQEGAVEVTYETLGDLVQRFHDHTQGIPVHRIQTTEGIQREQGRRIVRVEKMPNTRSRASMTHEEVEKLIARQVAEEMEAREVARNLESLNENEEEQEGENGGNENGRNGGNGNGDNRGNGNGGNGNKGNGNHGMNYGVFMPMARECTFQDFLKCNWLLVFAGNYGGGDGESWVIEMDEWSWQIKLGKLMWFLGGKTL
nr:hypothetical protein [Tanacetum cinerariifolium]